jgi:DNA processing protein
LNPTQDIEAWIALSLVPGLGPRSFVKLLQALGPPEEIFAASLSVLRGVVGTDLAQAILRAVPREAVAAALTWVNAESGRHLITLAEAQYPRLLLETADPPPLIYAMGRAELLAAPSIAVVGSRHATPQGAANAEAFAHALSDAGLTIVSGLALGIDAAAHRGGLRGQASSIAVVGTGLDRVYPRQNRDLAHALAENGTIISEFALGTPALAGNFPRRNRVISGLTRGCLVVEAAPSSGSLITARFAAEQGREVFAIPGSIHSPHSRGCHRLIKEGAKLVETAQDVLDELHWAQAAKPSISASAQSIAALSVEDDALLANIGHDPEPIDIIAARAGLAASVAGVGLLRLELAGLVASTRGGLYQRIVR